MFAKSSKAAWDKIKEYSTSPKSLLIVGLILACAGIALVSVGASLSNTVPQGFSSGPKTTEDSSLVARDDEGVPIEGIRPSDKAEVDCNADLQDPDAYRGYAYNAEFEMYGSHIANLSISEAKEILGGLSHVFVSVSFWVLHKNEIRELEVASKMIHEQMIALNTAYRGAKVIFQLRGIRYTRVSDKDYDGCSTSPIVVDLLRAINSTDSVAVIVCNPTDVNGVSRISGDGAHDWPAMANFSLQKGAKYILGVIYIRLSALKFSMTSLVHQFGHVFGLPHPFPPYQTCKLDGDFIPDTLDVYASSDSCLLENAPLCSPEEGNSALVWGVPGELFMDISPDDCRNKFTPGQILRMRAIMHAMMASGYEYLISEETSQVAYESFSRPVMESFYRALVSKMPGDAILRDQMEGRIDDLDVSQDTEVLQNELTSYADAFKYSELVTNHQVMDMTSSICFDNDEGPTSWVGFMKKEMLIDGVEITQTFHPERNFLHGHTVEIRLFSRDLQDSSLCTSSFVLIEGLSQRIMCDQAHISSLVMLTFHVSKISPLCISGVSLLSLFSPAIEFEQSAGEVPILLIDRAHALATQSTTASDLDAVAALFPLDKSSPEASCSSTRLERQPWWQLELERDFIMESITFTAPNDCTGSILLEKNGLNFGKIAADVANCLARNSSFTIDIYVLKNSYLKQERLKSQNLCAKSISLLPGTFSKISCQERHEGDTLLIQATDNRTLKSLQLCDLLIRGSRLVPIGDLISLASLSVSPKSLASQIADPVDNDERTCMLSNAELNESIWQVAFKSPTMLSYLMLDAKGPVEVELQGLQGEALWGSLNKTGILAIPNVLVSSIIIRKFRELCEIRVNETPRSEAISESSFLRIGQSGATGYWAAYPNPGVSMMRNFSMCEHVISREKKSIVLSERMPLKLSSIALSSNSIVPSVTVSVLTDSETITCGEERALFPWKYTKFVCQKTSLLVKGIEIKVKDIPPNKETISLCPVLVS